LLSGVRLTPLDDARVETPMGNDGHVTEPHSEDAFLVNVRLAKVLVKIPLDEKRRT
jgi:hypothetical protein